MAVNQTVHVRKYSSLFGNKSIPHAMLLSRLFQLACVLILTAHNSFSFEIYAQELIQNANFESGLEQWQDKVGGVDVEESND